MTTKFDYDVLTTRNIGFVTPQEQEQIRKARVFIVGVGGMGGACLQALVRAGLEHVVIADMDTFEVSNLNRQVFASLSDVGQGKVEVTCRKIRDINPNIKIEPFGPEWVDHLDQILDRVDFVVNGMDDIAAGIHLYRQAAKAGKYVIDAYASPLPSVTVVGPKDPRPEARLSYHTTSTAWHSLSQEQINRCKFREMLFVFANSTSAKHFHMEYALEVFQGKRSRPSFAPMVITTGNLMAFEALRLMMHRSAGTDYYGYFFNPWSCSIEKPYRGWVGQLILKYAETRLQSELDKPGSK